jgi:hypothetical protein
MELWAGSGSKVATDVWHIAASKGVIDTMWGRAKLGVMSDELESGDCV